MKLVFKVLIALFLLFWLYVYYKTKILKTADINYNYYVEYVRESNSYYLNERFSDTILNRFAYCLLSDLYVDDDFIYIVDTDNSTPNGNFYKIDKYKLKSVQLGQYDTVIIDNKKIEVGEINYTSAFWYLVFNKSYR